MNFKKLLFYLSSEKGVVPFFILLAGGVLLLLFFVLLQLMPNINRPNLSFFQQRQQQERPSQAQTVTVSGIKCPDVTGDGAVAANDIFKVRDKFGTYSGQPNYDPNYDINGDGSVSAADIQLTVAHFGQICSTLTTDVTAPEIGVFSLNPPRADTGVTLAAWSGANCDKSKIATAVSQNVDPNQSSLTTGTLTPQTNYCVQLVKQSGTSYLSISDPIGINTPPFANLEWVKTAFPNRFDFRYSNLTTTPEVSMRFGVSGGSCGRADIFDTPVSPTNGVVSYHNFSDESSFCAFLYYPVGFTLGEVQVKFSNQITFKKPQFGQLGYNSTVTIKFNNLQPGKTVDIYNFALRLFGSGSSKENLLVRQTGPGEINVKVTSPWGFVIEAANNDPCSNFTLGTVTCDVDFNFTNLDAKDAVAICTTPNCGLVWDVVGYGKTFKVQANLNLNTSQSWYGRGIADGARYSPFPSQ